MWGESTTTTTSTNSYVRENIRNSEDALKKKCLFEDNLILFRCEYNCSCLWSVLGLKEKWRSMVKDAEIVIKEIELKNNENRSTGDTNGTQQIDRLLKVNFILFVWLGNTNEDNIKNINLNYKTQCYIAPLSDLKTEDID